jgi:hypothetical protein
MKNEDKWPVCFEIVPFSNSILGEVFNLYFITCIANKEQLDTVAEVILFQAKVPIDGDRFVGTGLYTTKNIQSLLDYFNPRSKEWRGQYQAISKKVVSACNAVLP